MTETLNHTDTYTDDEPTGIAQLEAMLQPVAELKAPEQEKTVELPPVGAPRFMAAANRINAIFERRAVNKAHTEALADYRANDNSGYIDHLTKLESSELPTSEGQQFAERRLKKEQRIADNEKDLDTAKAMVRKIGLTALGLTMIGASKAKAGVQFAGETVSQNVRVATEIGKYEAGRAVEGAKAGAQLASETVGQSVRKATEFGRYQAGRAAESAKTGLTAGANKAEAFAGKVGQKMEGGIEAGITKVVDVVDSTKEARKYRNEAFAKEALAAKEQALNRKYERHAKWMNRKRKLGSFVLRTRDLTVRAQAAGEAAVDTWKNHQA